MLLREGLQEAIPVEPCLFPREPVISGKGPRMVAGGYPGFCIIDMSYA
jgi:hypothetical protein